MESNIKNKNKKPDPQKPVLEIPGGQKISIATRRPHIHLTEEEIIGLMENEAVARVKIGNLIKEMLGNDGDPPEEDMDNKNSKTEEASFDINSFV